METDESALTSRKYNRGKVIKRNKKKETTWILGMLDTTTKKSVILYVARRNKRTLLREIKKHVKTQPFGQIVGRATTV